MKRKRALWGRNPPRDSRIRRVNRLPVGRVPAGTYTSRITCRPCLAKIPGFGAEPQGRFHTAPTRLQSYHLVIRGDGQSGREPRATVVLDRQRGTARTGSAELSDERAVEDRGDAGGRPGPVPPGRVAAGIRRRTTRSGVNTPVKSPESRPCGSRNAHSLFDLLSLYVYPECFTGLFVTKIHATTKNK